MIKSSTTRLLAGACAAAAAALVAVLGAPAASAQSADPQAPNSTYVVGSYQTTGWQIYRCSDAGVLVFDRPYADLPNEIVHWGPGTRPEVPNQGPRWQTYGSQGYSLIRGGAATVFPNPDPARNIPDLLVPVAQSEGSGPLGSVDYVLRTNSTGGTDGRVGRSCAVGSGDVWIDYRTTYTFLAQYST